ncbi:tRNA3(Ser)-specific nuclease WapA precursor [Pelotomaculum sp. FP]|uniref:DUF6531 domain-containing protein n=1 Tax=Pelotomaculum sp. FP TaxID=261474 RepID=UPI001066C2B2|nr:DUF6531 domain-containing protein [Pelotomaculum sp. FP]TEB16645.1 tRNA3(Ser)-specific nuclease WapA precursor [Pelotomaculum sp. FP]
MKKLLTCLLILSLLINISIPVYAHNNESIAEQNTSILPGFTVTNEMDGSDGSTHQTGKIQSVSDVVYERSVNPTEITTTELQPPIKNEILELNLAQNGSVEDFVYGQSAFYNTLKKHNRLDLLNKLPAKVPSVSNEEYKVETSVSGDQDLSVPNDVYNVTDQSILAMAMQSATDQAWYNTLVGPSAMNGVDNKQYSAWANIDEVVSPYTGDLTIKQTDLKLPGRNGLDLEISRIYQSNQALLGNRLTSGIGHCYTDYSTYYLNRYALGAGWAFGFPSVQVEETYGRKELYYHSGDGKVYHVNFSAGNYSNLENYYLEDVKFNNDTGFSNGQVSSQYSFTTADQTKRYFAADGRLLGIVDRFGNQITFKHTEMPVTNSAPNNDFTFDASDIGMWSNTNTMDPDPNKHYYFDQTFGKDDNTSLKFTGSGVSQESESWHIPVLPNTKYHLSGYLYNQLTSGNAQLFHREYDQYKNIVQASNAAMSSTAKNTWEPLSQTFVTSSSTYYVQLVFSNNNATGTSWLDKLRFDRAWPLISEITDSIGRKVTFTYNDTLFQDNVSDAGTITVMVTDPSETNNHTLTYTRGIIKCWYNWNNEWQELRRYPRLYSYNDGEQTNWYNYTLPQYPLNYGDYTYVLFSYDESKSEFTYGKTYQLLLNEIYLRNSKTVYEYEKATKRLGDNGFYDIYRITKRFEQGIYYDTGYWGTDYQRTYSYSGNYNGTIYDNETGYPNQQDLSKDANYQFTSTMQQNNGLIIKETYKGNKEYKKEEYNSSGEKIFTCYEEYDPNFKDNVTKIRTEQYNASGNVSTLYTGYTYNDWGGTASGTVPLTLDQWNDATFKSQHTTSFTYDPTYKFLKTKSFYQKPGLLLTESTNYDSMGRVTTTTNAKGETTEYQYGDASHPGNYTRVNIHHGGGRTTRTDYDYSGAYYAFPTTVTLYYTEEGVPKNSTTYKGYEFLWGNVVSETDALGNVTSYSYDSQGRLQKITHPQSTGTNEAYVAEDNFDYDNSVFTNYHNQQRVLRVRYYKTKNGSIFLDTYSYYNDQGNLSHTIYYDYEREDWILAGNAYNNYGQLIWVKDANGNETNYQSDEWDRLKKVTDPQGNYYTFGYDIFSRTNTTYFVPADTGIAENHYVETYDQWSRTISRKGFPDGPGGSAVVEEKYEYDFVGNLTKLTDANNNATLYGYDALNRLNKVTNPLGETTDYDYDRLGDLTQIKQYQDTSTFSTVKQYSERGAMVSKQLPAGQPTTYKYNANGLPVEITDSSGKITTMQYYPDNKLAEKRANQDKIEYYYSPLGGVEKYQPANDTTGNGEALTYEFYSTGLAKQRTVGGYSVGFQYDILGNKTKLTDPFGLSTDYQYNNLNRLTTVTSDGKNFTYEYYGDGMVKAVNYPQLANGSSIRTEYTYDNINRLKTMINWWADKLFTQYSYGYDNNGNITSVTENGEATIYTYDALNRLTGIQRPNGEQISYQYDTRGNRILTTVNGRSLDGFIPGEISYNNWDELATFTTGGNTYNYFYDPEGLRNNKVTPTGTTRYHYDNRGRVVAESDASGGVTAETIWGIQALARCNLARKVVLAGRIFLHIDYLKDDSEPSPIC